MTSIYTRIAAIIAVFIFGMGTGFLIQGWRLNAAHAAEILTYNNKYHNIELSIERQNGGINLMQYKLDVAKESQEKAEANALFIKNQYSLQNKKADKIIATTCSAMLESLKGVKQ